MHKHKWIVLLLTLIVASCGGGETPTDEVAEEGAESAVGTPEGGGTTPEGGGFEGGGLCAPDCAGKLCGNDGCEGSCGECGPGLACGNDGQCFPCTADCTDKICGDDGCGGTCGTPCPDGTVCVGGTHCVEGACEPDCANKVCGDDGCGGNCGACPAGQTCNDAFACEDACVPECGAVCDACTVCGEGYACGGGDASTCVSLSTAGGNGLTCAGAMIVNQLPFLAEGNTDGATNDYGFEESTCPGEEWTGWGNGSNDVAYVFTAPCSASYQISLEAEYDSLLYVVADCADIANTCYGASDETSSTESVSVTIDAGTQVYIIVDGYKNDDNISGNYTLTVGEPCTPDCTGKTCGDDGCGGACGECVEETQFCNDASVCEDCTCSGKQCGDDGCWNTCGTCDEGYFCDDAQLCQVCTCSGKSCGDDGCGESCGECGELQACVEGACVQAICSAVDTLTCGDSLQGISNMDAGYTKAIDKYTCQPYASDDYGDGPEIAYAIEVSEAKTVTISDTQAAVDILILQDEGNGCQPTESSCIDGAMSSVSFAALPGATYYAVFDAWKGVGHTFDIDVECCDASCAGKICGDDGCGAECGECAEGTYCNEEQTGCLDACGAKICGTGENWVSCGDCGEGMYCNDDQTQCLPCTCDGKQCGTNECWDSCGSCEENFFCSDTFKCQACSCDGKQCGVNECWVSCGECGDNQFCNDTDKCEACTCDGKSCGDNGCGETCGECQDGTSCNPAGSCVEAVCSSIGTVSCGETVEGLSNAMGGSTQNIAYYPCQPIASDDYGPSPEIAYALTVDTATTVNVVESSSPLDTMVLMDEGAGCKATTSGCVVGGISGASFEATPGTTYYIVFDAYNGTIEEGFTFTIECGAGDVGGDGP